MWHVRGVDERGFSLVELMVVVLILGILAGIAIFTFLSGRDNAREKAVWSDLHNAATTMEVHAAEEGSYLGASGDFRESDGVTVRIAPEPALAPNYYCLEADHEAIGGSGTWDWHLEAGESTPQTGGCS